MRRVVSTKTANEARVQLRSGATGTASIRLVWLLTLECGHNEVRYAEHPESPTKVKCTTCTKGTR